MEMLNFLDDDNDFENNSHTKKFLEFADTGKKDRDKELEDDYDDEDFSDDSEQANDGDMDSEYDSDLESENSDDANF
jgi:hypothetical protein